MQPETKLQTKLNPVKFLIGLKQKAFPMPFELPNMKKRYAPLRESCIYFSLYGFKHNKKLQFMERTRNCDFYLKNKYHQLKKSYR